MLQSEAGDEKMILSAEKEYVFPQNSITKSCHASTILPLEDGTVIAAWFGGKNEKDKSVEIYVSIRDDEGRWGKPFSVSENDDIPTWNPVLHKNSDGSVTLFYKYGKEISDWITKFVKSSDGGKTWSSPEELVPGDTSGGRGPVKNKCLYTSGGLLLAPASTEQKKKWLPFIDVSFDGGKTWQKTPEMERAKYKGANVHVHCFMRSDKGAVYRSDSFDGGITWKKPYRTKIPNNNSGIDCCTDKSGRLWLIYNPISENWGVRHPLSLAFSNDNGKKFTEVLVPEPGSGEFSYPAIVYFNGALHISYTYKRKQIVYWKICLEE